MVTVWVITYVSWVISATFLREITQIELLMLLADLQKQNTVINAKYKFVFALMGRLVLKRR